MLTIYPSHRLEDLLEILHGQLQAQRPEHIFDKQYILVESRGMEHYLKGELALRDGVAINYEFPLPIRFIYDTCRAVLGEERVPQRSLYRRETLVWRIFKLLACPSFTELNDAQQANAYWQDSIVKRYQLAKMTADAFEQYDLFRPQWLQIWQRDQRVGLTDYLEPWQQRLWMLIHAQLGASPAQLMQQTMQSLAEACAQLPKHLHIFALNNLPPQSVEFFQQLAKHVDIHLYHLNPCAEYWGDLQTQQQLAQQYRQYALHTFIDNDDNPLLRNYGQLGRDFFRQLVDVSLRDANEQIEINYPNTPANSVLARIQYDLRHFLDEQIDGQALRQNVHISACHTALREVQVLHDYLLDLFNQHPDLKPHDVIVMCPGVEDYAPIVSSVFSVKGEQAGRLPASISDRRLLDESSLVQVYLEMLTVNETRFNLNQIMQYLHLPEVQKRFGLSVEDVDRIAVLLNEANVKWGRDATHKAAILNTEHADGMFTWQWGIERLLLGAVSADDESFDGELALLHHLNSQDVLLFDKLLRLLLGLSKFNHQLTMTAAEWGQYLNEFLDTLFSAHHDETIINQLKAIHQQLNALTSEADYTDALPLPIVAQFIEERCSQPDAINRFMTGKVTFSSMVPMRSVPFKVVCMLGLNDGAFPRQNPHNSVNLMNLQTAQLGDRSRRNEDRYIFLEALISAREQLYLSYQGLSAKNNTSQAPSLVLQEFIDYLSLNYHLDIRTYYPLQPFSPDNFNCSLPVNSFAKDWLTTWQKPVENRAISHYEFQAPRQVTVQELCAVFKAPLKHFVQSQFGITFPDFRDVDEDEHFQLDGLQRFWLHHHFAELQQGGGFDDEAVDAYLNALCLQGEVLDSLTLREQVHEEVGIYQYLPTDIEFTFNFTHAETNLSLNDHEMKVSAQVMCADNGNAVLCYHKSVKGTELFETWLEHLLRTLSFAKPVSTELHYWNGSSKKENKWTQWRFAPTSPQQAACYLTSILTSYCAIHSTPTLMHIERVTDLFMADRKIITSADMMSEKKIANYIDLLNGSTNHGQLRDQAYVNFCFPQGVSEKNVSQTAIFELFCPQGLPYPLVKAK